MKTFKVKTDKIINNYVDTETGEILEVNVETKHHKIVVDNKQEFYWTYISVLGLIDDLDKVSIKLLYYCNFYCQWNTNMIALTKPVLKDIEDKLGLKYQTVRNAISKLKKQNILIYLGASTYRVNPRYYWKGESTERLKTMKYILDVECPNC